MSGFLKKFDKISTSVWHGETLPGVNNIYDERATIKSLTSGRLLSFVKTRWILLSAVAVFIAFKIPHLYYPYYWDESWLYSPGIMAMHAHGASLMPNAIDVSYTRGHPLLFQAIFTLWVDVFGYSHFTMHCFSLLISLALIIAVHECMLRLFNRKAAIISVLLLLVNTMFFVQSSFVIPDIMIALFTFSSLYFYATRRYLLTAIFLTALFYTKESGLILAIILAADLLVSFCYRKISLKDRLLSCASVFIPIVLGSLFYVVQKYTLGWYQYPGAFASHPNFHLLNAYYWFRALLGLLFYDENRYLFFLLLLSLSAFAAIKKKNIDYAFLFLPALVLYFLDNVSIYHEKWLDTRLILLFLSAGCIAVVSLGRLGYFCRNHRQKFFILCVIFLVSYLGYYSAYSFQGRYIFTALVILCAIAGVFFDFFISQINPRIFYPVLTMIVCVGLYCFIRDTGDSDLGAFDGMKVQQGVVNYFEQNKLYDKVIGAASYLDVVHLRNPYSGYLNSAKTFGKAIMGNYNRQMDYVVFESVELPDDYQSCKNDSAFQLVYRSEIGKYWAEVYARK